MKKYVSCLCRLPVLFIIFITPVFAASSPVASKPNIIFILADDLGYGDLSSYGATDIQTPNIDRLASEGLRFTNFYTPANTCSPSRASLLTGRYPPRTGVNAVLSYDTIEGLPLTETTMAEMLRDAGYQTAMYGKWHLGQVEALMPWHQGFDEFVGTATSNDDKNFVLYQSQGRHYETLRGTVDQPALIQIYTAHAIKFLQNQSEDRQQKPFFLYLAYNAPHVPLYPSQDNSDWQSSAGLSKRGTYGDVVQELDYGVGRVLAAVKTFGFDDNTIVIFTSDNGGWRTMRDWGGSNGVLREGKLTAFEGGHRVPALVRWPGHTASGLVNNDVVTMMDWFPTFLQLAGGGSGQSSLNALDGRDITALLNGSGKREQTPFFYFGLRPPIEAQDYVLAAVRVGKWKYKAAQSGYYPQLLEPLMRVGLYFHGEMLFDLDSDPGEQHNIIDEHRELARELKQVMQDFRDHNPMPPPAHVNALSEDNAGWEKLWTGIVASAALILVVLLVVLLVVVMIVRRLLQRWRQS